MDSAVCRSTRVGEGGWGGGVVGGGGGGGGTGDIELLFSCQAKPTVTFTEDEQEKLTERIQNAGTEVVNAKAGAVS